EMAKFAGAVRGRVRLSIWYHLDPGLPALLHDFIGENPEIAFSIVELPAPEMMDALRQGEIDIGCPLLSPSLDLTDLDFQVFRQEPAVLAIAPDSPLAHATTVALKR